MNFGGTMPGGKGQWGPGELKKKHQSIGDRAFNQGFRMRAYADSDYDFPNFKKALELGKVESIPNPLPPNWITGMGVDLSSDKRPGNVIWCGALSPEGIKRPLEIRAIKASSPEVARNIGQVAATWRPQFIVVENNAYQGALIEWINEYPERFPYWCEIIPFQTGNNKANPEFGIKGIDIEFMNGGWVVPRELNPLVNGHDLACPCGPCRWKREVETFPHCAQIDTAMAMWFFREGCRFFRYGQEADNGQEQMDPAVVGEFWIPADELVED